MCSLMICFPAFEAQPHHPTIVPPAFQAGSPTTSPHRAAPILCDASLSFHGTFVPFNRHNLHLTPHELTFDGQTGSSSPTSTTHPSASSPTPRHAPRAHLRRSNQVIITDINYSPLRLISNTQGTRRCITVCHHSPSTTPSRWTKTRPNGASG